MTGPDKPTDSSESFPIKVQLDTSGQWYEIGRGARVQVFGNLMGAAPTSIHGAGQVAFDMNTTGQLNIQGFKIAVPLVPNAISEGLESAFTVQRRKMSNEHLIITALVRQLGGVASVSEHELLIADKVKHMTSHKVDDPLRFVIRVED